MTTRRLAFATSIVLLIGLGILQSFASPQQRAETAAACSSDVRAEIDIALAEAAKLKDMAHGKVYELPAGGKVVSGYGDDFLRRRTAQEVQTSGLASGCGDYAIVFLHHIEKCGFKANFIDSAEISTASLRSRDSGHTVVAVRDEGRKRWILADPTAARVISENWDPSSKTFYGNYWIGYVGPLSEYPAHDHESLKQFYAATLQSVPEDVLESQLFRFRFIVDDSLKGKDGEYLNPRLDAFLRDNGKFLDEQGIHPRREIEIRLVKGGDDAKGSMTYTGSGWVCTVGLKSAMSPSFVSYMETQVAHRLAEK